MNFPDAKTRQTKKNRGFTWGYFAKSRYRYTKNLENAIKKAEKYNSFVFCTLNNFFPIFEEKKVK